MSRSIQPVPSGDGRARFSVGDRVRVKAGTMDTDFPDMPLGGWAGTISDIDTRTVPTIYLVDWTPETMAAMHPVYARRCEREGLDEESSWLESSVLEPDLGGPLVMEQPKSLVPLPLNQEHNEDRTRAVFGLTSDEELPAVEDTSLKRYHAFLSQCVSFPFPAVDEMVQPILVTRLLPVELADADDGLLIEVTYDDGEAEEMSLHVIDALPMTQGGRDVEAYCEWFSSQWSGPSEVDAAPSPSTGMAATLLTGLLGAMLLGAGLYTREDSYLTCQVGAILLGVIGGFVGASYETLFRRVNRLPPGVFGGLLFGLLGGAVVGGIAGMLIVTYMGALPGAIVGTLYAMFRAHQGDFSPGKVRNPLMFACFGGLCSLFVDHGWNALLGCGLGVMGGIALVVALVFGASFFLGRLLPRG